MKDLFYFSIILLLALILLQSVLIKREVRSVYDYIKTEVEIMEYKGR